MIESVQHVFITLCNKTQHAAIGNVISLGFTQRRATLQEPDGTVSFDVAVMSDSQTLDASVFVTVSSHGMGTAVGENMLIFWWNELHACMAGMSTNLTYVCVKQWN